ncbi:O-antigen ligase family protein [Capillimicrobium parvum]|uniref:O-antigen ligase family protein n=1 Tax=Capillimicrobium parvum TaxID=2884022 RepID=UPI00216B5D41|nr:O-antigen ligase family protein [Capillimicrobium parvum]
MATTTTAPDAGRVRRLRLGPAALRRPLAIAAIAVGVVLVEVVVARGLTGPQSVRLLALVAAVAGMALAFRFPLAVAIALLVIAGSLFHSAYFTWSVGPVQLHLEEIVLLALGVVAVVAPKRQTWGGAAGLALAAFLAIATFCAWLGVQDGRVAVDDAFNWARPFAFYGIFWIVLRLFPDARSLRRLLIAGLVCGAITGVLALVMQFTGSLTDVFQGSGGQQIYTQATQAGLGGLKRIRQPGLAFSYILFWWSIVAALTWRGRFRMLMWALVTASALNIVLSFNRNMWVGVLVGLGLVLILGGVRLRHRLLVGLAIGLTGVVLLFTAVVNSGNTQRLDPIVERAATVVTPRQIGEESSLRDRANETAQAWRTVKANPVFGVGAGADYGVRFNHEEGNGIWVNTTQRFLHNQWLWLLLVGGVPALVAFAAFLGVVLAKAWGPGRTVSQTALGAGIAMICLSAFVMPYLGVEEFCLAIGVVAGAIVASRDLARRA